MSKLKKISSRQILDSRGLPTLEVEVQLDSGVQARAAVPSGASTGAHEAHELRDNDKSKYHGKSVLKAISNVTEKIAPAIMGSSVLDQEAIDQKLIALDGTENKKNLGANAILGVSLAVLKAAALSEKKSLFAYVGGDQATKLPVPLMNILNGGAHADNGLDVQEYMIAPVCGGSFHEALRAGSEVFHSLKKILKDKKLSTSVGDEGGFAPKLKNNEEALDLISQAVEQAGYRLGEDIYLALDVAATEFYQDGKYAWQGEMLSSEDMISVYSDWQKKYPLRSIEDGLAEDDWKGWSALTAKLGSKLQLVGDDLFVTNPKRLQMGIDQKSANAILVKVNQIGTFTETRKAVEMARKANFHSVMSHRSGETEDTTIADLAVGLMSEQIKTGSLCRGERTAKYNQLLRIEEELGTKGQFRGKSAFDF